MKRVRDSMTAKIFLLTMGLFLLVCLVTCGLISAALPVTYRGELEEDLQRGTEKLKKELEKYDSAEEAENLLKLFAANNQAEVTLLNAEGKAVFSDGAESTVMEVDEAERVALEADEAEEVLQEADEADDAVMEIREVNLTYQYEYGNAGKTGLALKIDTVKLGEEDYTLLVAGTMRPVNQAMEILKKILPGVLTIILFISILCSGTASVLLTKPIGELCRISEKMAALQFQEKCVQRRTDEVGQLAANLNKLSDNLSASMEELGQANERLKRDIEKERIFFSAASHELKTPLTILKGHLGGMCQNVGGYRNRDYYLKRSYEVTETMEELVQEILSISRIESGAYELKWEQTDLAELARLQIAEELDLLEEKNMNLETDIPGHVNWIVDAGMMVKVFRNLLVNAIRYSPEKAAVKVHMKEQKECLLFWVENTGVWLPKESLNKIFDAFYREEDSRNRKLGGSGLGLYIVNMAVQQHGGVCGAENYRDGVRIWIRLPRRTKSQSKS